MTRRCLQLPACHSPFPVSIQNLFNHRRSAWHDNIISGRNCIRAIHLTMPETAVEALTPDFQGQHALVAQVLHGATFGAYHAAAIAVVNQWIPGRLQSHGQALYGSLSFGAGGMLGGLLSGYTWETIGAAWTYTIGSGFALAGFVWLLLGWKQHGVPHAPGREGAA